MKEYCTILLVIMKSLSYHSMYVCSYEVMNMHRYSYIFINLLLVVIAMMRWPTQTSDMIICLYVCTIPIYVLIKHLWMVCVYTKEMTVMIRVWLVWISYYWLWLTQLPTSNVSDWLINIVIIALSLHYISTYKQE